MTKKKSSGIKGLIQMSKTAKEIIKSNNELKKLNDKLEEDDNLLKSIIPLLNSDYNLDLTADHISKKIIDEMNSEELKNTNEQELLSMAIDFAKNRKESYLGAKSLVEKVKKAEDKKANNDPKKFKDMFKNPKLVEALLDVLKKVDPPILNVENEYIGRSKGAFCVWIDEMKRQGLIHSYSDRKIYARLLNEKIYNFSIDESMFGKFQKRAVKNYGMDFKTYISEIKLSQNSQERKLGK